MSTHSDNQTDVFPQTQPPDIPSQVSSLTRADLETTLGLTLSDWQWRVLVGLGLLADQEHAAAEWREAIKRPYAVVSDVTAPEITILLKDDEQYAARNYPLGYRMMANDKCVYEVAQTPSFDRVWRRAH